MLHIAFGAENRRIAFRQHLNGFVGCSICDHYFHHVTYCMNTNARISSDVLRACQNLFGSVFGGCDLFVWQRSPARSLFCVLSQDLVNCNGRGGGRGLLWKRMAMEISFLIIWCTRATDKQEQNPFSSTQQTCAGQKCDRRIIRPNNHKNVKHSEFSDARAHPNAHSRRARQNIDKCEKWRKKREQNEFFGRREV